MNQALYAHMNNKRKMKKKIKTSKNEKKEMHAIFSFQMDKLSGNVIILAHKCDYSSF
jgi:hypothetical protein